MIVKVIDPALSRFRGRRCIGEEQKIRKGQGNLLCRNLGGDRSPVRSGEHLPMAA